MRHAKSSWAQSAMADHERPLNKRGKRDAPKMGQMLVARNLVPQRLFYSSAQRTVMTARLLSEQFHGETTVGGSIFDADSAEVVEDLYLAPWPTYIELMVGLSKRNAQAKLDSIMLLGHNPGIEWLLEKLTGQSHSVPTATIAHIEMKGDDWGDSAKLVSSGDYRMIDLWRPKEI